ncbi:MAG: hypothetical protein L7F77_14865 [Candidatus Magnetominusculus sp. LBB02]|nr:hypothetical protein [Candidatus Magnetominusculus sp. LBB02]
MDDKAVITGIGVTCAAGRTPDELWDSLLCGRGGAVHMGIGEFPCNAAALAECPTPETLNIKPRDSRIMKTHSYLLIDSAIKAYSAAGIAAYPEITPGDIGFFAGLPMIDYEIDDLLAAVAKSSTADGLLDYGSFYLKGYREIYPLWPLSMLNNIALCQASVRLSIRGENTVFSAHADSGVSAIAEGVMAVSGGRSKVALVGGVSEKVTALSLARGHIAGVLKSCVDDILPCRPFSSLRCGTILGDGAAFLAIETLSSAHKRGVTPIAAITGWGRAFGTDERQGPSIHAIKNSMSAALSMAGLRPADISLLIAHGDGTAAGDRREAEAIGEMFHSSSLSVISTKGALGSLFCAAAPIDAAVAAYAINAGLIPPSLYSTPVDEAVNFALVTQSPLQKQVDRVMINCHSYEGQAASLIVERVG